MNISNFKHVYLIGIGGISISAIAKLFLHYGIRVSGSDKAPSEITAELEKLGVKVYVGENAEHVAPDVDLIVYSEAVQPEHSERQEGARRNIKELAGAEFWGEFSRNKKVIAVSGTNGKSTTTAMIGHILVEAGFDPTVVVGTRVLGWNSNIRVGTSEWLVIEADEFRAKMLHYNPQIAVITNLAPDHLDFYKDLDDIVGYFQKWVEQIPPQGGLVINKNDLASARLGAGNEVVVKTFSVGGSEGLRSAGLTVRSDDVSWVGDVSFNIVDDAKDWGLVELAVPGTFNVANALAAAAATDLAGIKHDKIIKALSTFKGTWRRFEMVGEYNGALIVSDYAHHPDGIRATLEAARGWYPFHRIILLYQPHQHNRTRKLFTDFVTSFDKADELILAEIYDVAGRSEADDKAVSSRDLVEAIKKRKEQVYYAPDLHQAEAMLKSKIQRGDVVIIMGAGDVDSVARRLV